MAAYSSRSIDADGGGGLTLPVASKCGINENAAGCVVGISVGSTMCVEIDGGNAMAPAGTNPTMLSVDAKCDGSVLLVFKSQRSSMSGLGLSRINDRKNPNASRPSNGLSTPSAMFSNTSTRTRPTTCCAPTHWCRTVCFVVARANTYTSGQSMSRTYSWGMPMSEPVAPANESCPVVDARLL
jgi:hypothetical protein